MKGIYYFIVCCLLITGIACNAKLSNLSQSACEKFEFGRIETRHVLTPIDKQQLEKKGITIAEYVFENQYLGTWKKNWNNKNLEKTAIKLLKPFTLDEKIASGGQSKELNLIVKEPGESIVLIQTIGNVNPSSLSAFGVVQFERDHFYRMIVPNNKLRELLEFSCVRTFSIMKPNNQHD